MLAGSIAVLGIIWMVILPAYARQPQMRQHLKWLDDQGIDPSAMYYTELAVMEEILAKQRQAELRRTRHPDN
ncbi:signal peptide protein [Rhodopirellula maiorica SM1]|uniref:Signal peptide protein n=1 Tax=Rhodopirellula maiorica SM1 TaxID=1265738 RepID=M5RI31_9BACT|nr:signal peptide protein [Rhodopirellula maiorica SM1]